MVHPTSDACEALASLHTPDAQMAPAQHVGRQCTPLAPVHTMLSAGATLRDSALRVASTLLLLRPQQPESAAANPVLLGMLHTSCAGCHAPLSPQQPRYLAYDRCFCSEYCRFHSSVLAHSEDAHVIFGVHATAPDAYAS